MCINRSTSSPDNYSSVRVPGAEEVSDSRRHCSPLLPSDEGVGRILFFTRQERSSSSLEEAAGLPGFVT